MPRLTLRTLLAYLDDTVAPAEARALGKKVAASDDARQLVEKIKRVTRRRGLANPVPDSADDAVTDPNTVAEYLDNALDSETLKQLEETCLESDVHLAEVAACHQILTLVLTEPVRVPPRAHRRMYGLVQPPMSVPGRRPNKTLPISAAAPPAGPAEPDDADAALLLGLKRYSAATTWAARLALFGAAAVLVLILAGAALLSLPPKAPPAPPVARSAVALAPADPPVPEPVDPKPAPAPEKKDGAAGAPKAPDPVEKPKDAGAGAVEVAPPPHAPTKPGAGENPFDNRDPISLERVPAGRVATKGALVVGYRPDPAKPDAHPWGRLRDLPDTDNPNDPDAVFTAEPVMALPGYRADVLLGEFKRPVLEVCLWGNVPEQVPVRAFESKVTFHKPAAGFDADVTLHAGRVYLRSKKGPKELTVVRVRVATEVWDLTLPDPATEVLVELVSGYRPAGNAVGDDLRREARVAVTDGDVAFFAAKQRFAQFQIARGKQISWDSLSGPLVGPADLANPKESERRAGEPRDKDALRTVLAQLADAAVQPDLSVVLLDRVPPKGDAPNRELAARVAVFAWAALADSNAAGCRTFKKVLDQMTPDLPWSIRQALVTALVQWVGREKGNAALLRAFLAAPDMGLSAAQAGAAVDLLRGFVSPAQPNPEQLDKLPRYQFGKLAEFEGQETAQLVRDAARWNLIAAERGTWVPSPTGAEPPGDWKKRVEDVKAAAAKKK